MPFIWSLTNQCRDTSRLTMHALRHQDRSRQKTAAFSIENETDPETKSQYFQVSVNVLEARKLTSSNPHSQNTYVVMVLGKKKQRTSIRRNMENPQYREYFIFELYASVREIQRSTLWLAVMEPRMCAPPKLLGEASIDLGAIWIQPRHQVIHKWAQLNLPREAGAGSVGFLKVDISIMYRSEVQALPVIINDDKVEDNLLSPGSEQLRACYQITIHGAFSLPHSVNIQSNNRNTKPPTTFVKVSFCGLTAKTAIQHRNANPAYCEQISFVEMFPNITQLIHLEACAGEGCTSRVLASTDLRLADVSHDGENGFLPTFGPSLLHMYSSPLPGNMGTVGEDGPYHRGTLLVSLKTIVPYYKQDLRSTNVEPIVPVNLNNLWQLEDFRVFCPILEVSMLDRRVAGKLCGVAMTIGDMPSDGRGDDEFLAMKEFIRARKLHYTGAMDVMKSRPVYGYLDFPNAFPVLQLGTRLPDFRFRMYRNNMIRGIVRELEKALSEIERRLKSIEYANPNELKDELNKAVDDAAGNILKLLDIIHYSNPTPSSSDDLMRRYSTELDQKQLALQKEEIEKIYYQICKRNKSNSMMNLIHAVSKGKDYPCGTRKEVKLILAEAKALTQNLRNLIFKSCEGWPDIVIWLLNSGSRVAFTKIAAADIIYSVVPEQSGRNCGRIQTVYLKPLKCPKHMNNSAPACFCIAGKVELLIWMGLFRQNSVFENFLPNEYTLKTRDMDMCVKSPATMLECRAFIYRAKLKGSIDSSTFAYAFVRINAFNFVQETKVKQKTLTPVWNQVLKIHRMVYTSQDRLEINTPTIMVEVCGADLSGKTDLIGRFEVMPVVDDRQEYEYAPKLRWYDLYKGAENTGQVLMSMQLLQVPEVLMRTTAYNSLDESFHASGVKDLDFGEDLEQLPPNLIPQYSSFKVDVYWWGLRDVTITKKPCVILEIDDLAIKSDIISDKKPNCNFPNGRTSQVFEAPLTETYCPPLNIRLYDSSTFGRTLFLGTNVVKNPNKYIVNWLPKTEREASLKSVSIKSSDFFQVHQMLYVKKSNRSLEESNEYINPTTVRSIIKTRTKRPKWRRWFSRKEPDEEEYVLLPMFTKEKDRIKVVKKIPKTADHTDWWARFFAAQKETYEDSCGIDRITIYESELESQPEFSKFKDWCSTLKLYNGKKTGIPDEDESIFCGFLKAGIAIYRWPPSEDTVAVSHNGVELSNGYFDELPSNDPAQFLVRVYAIKGINLRPKESTSKADPYIVLNCGNKRIGDRTNCVMNSNNPVFGKMYELRCTLPEEYLLTVSVYDHTFILEDELLGSTTIDLEDRIYSKHRARVGISTEYNVTGPTKWRDCMKPSKILEDLCSKNHLPHPIYPDSATVVVNGVEYKDTDGINKSYTSPAERKENICLSILHKWQTLPIVGHYLVPEHVETRTLVNPDKPGVDQGKIQLWIDIFPIESNAYIPAPVDITPRKVEEYELRVIVWDVQGVKVIDGEHSGKKASDIYVKAWIASTEQTQYTDVHYRSLKGDGSFNWRMIFHFQFQHAERRIVVKEVGPFIEVEEHLPPILVVHVVDSDAISQDDFLASLALNLNKMPRGVKQAHQCTLTDLELCRKVDLFAMRSIRAWWPLKTTNRNTGYSSYAGVIDLELTLLPKEKAILMPVGIGREPPAPLPEPCRMDSLASLTNPCGLERLFRHGGADYLIIGAILIIVTFLAFMYFDMPFIPWGSEEIV